MRAVTTVAVAALLSLVACSTAEQGSTTADRAPAVDQPTFTGPYAAEFTALYRDASSDFVRQVLADETITDAEYAEMAERMRDCLAGEGVIFSGFADDGSFSASDAPNGGDTYALVLACGTEAGHDSIGLLHDLMTTNPDNLDVPTIMADCLVRLGAAPAGYDGESYSRDGEHSFDQLRAYAPGADLALSTCSDDPLDLRAR